MAAPAPRDAHPIPRPEYFARERDFTSRDLELLELVTQPAWISDVADDGSKMTCVWANSAGLNFWGEKSATDVDFSDASLASIGFIRSIIDAFRDGVRTSVMPIQLSFYPKGVPTPVVMRPVPILLSGFGEEGDGPRLHLLVVCHRVEEPSHESLRREGLLRYTSSKLWMYSVSAPKHDGSSAGVSAGAGSSGAVIKRLWQNVEAYHRQPTDESDPSQVLAWHWHNAALHSKGKDSSAPSSAERSAAASLAASEIMPPIRTESRPLVDERDDRADLATQDELAAACLDASIVAGSCLMDCVLRVLRAEPKREQRETGGRRSPAVASPMSKRSPVPSPTEAAIYPYVWFRLRVLKIRDPATAQMALLVQEDDLTETIQAQIRERRANAARRANEAFLASFSHEIRTPLNGVLGALQCLKTTSLSHLQLDFVETASFSAVSLLNTLDDVLAWKASRAARSKSDSRNASRSGSGAAVPRAITHLAKTQLRRIPQLLEEIATMFAPNAFSKGVTLVVDYPVRLQVPGVDIVTDAERLRQIVSNFTSNAIKYTPKGGRISLRLHVELISEGVGSAVEATVAPRGAAGGPGARVERPPRHGNTKSSRLDEMSASASSLLRGSEARAGSPVAASSIVDCDSPLASDDTSAAGNYSPLAADTPLAVRSLVSDGSPLGNREPLTETAADLPAVRIELSVQDNGPGIPEKHRRHIFDDFFRVPGTTENEFTSHSAGLGLAVVKELATLLGGSVFVDSSTAASEHGSTFTFRFNSRLTGPEASTVAAFTMGKGGGVGTEAESLRSPPSGSATGPRALVGRVGPQPSPAMAMQPERRAQLTYNDLIRSTATPLRGVRLLFIGGNAVIAPTLLAFLVEVGATVVVLETMEAAIDKLREEYSASDPLGYDAVLLNTGVIASSSADEQRPHEGWSSPAGLSGTRGADSGSIDAACSRLVAELQSLVATQPAHVLPASRGVDSRPSKLQRVLTALSFRFVARKSAAVHAAPRRVLSAGTANLSLPSVVVMTPSPVLPELLRLRSHDSAFQSTLGLPLLPSRLLATVLTTVADVNGAGSLRSEIAQSLSPKAVSAWRLDISPTQSIAPANRSTLPPIIREGGLGKADKLQPLNVVRSFRGSVETNAPVDTDAGIEEETKTGPSVIQPRVTRVLVVDDVRLNRRVLCHLLPRVIENVTTVCAVNGREAADAVAVEPRGFALVLMDLQMPILNGWQALSAMKAVPGFDSPIIAVSAGLEGSTRERCLEHGFADTIDKPVMLPALQRVVSGVLKTPGPKS